MKKIRIAPTFNIPCPKCKSFLTFIYSTNIPLNQVNRIYCSKCKDAINITLLPHKIHGAVLEIVEIDKPISSS